MSRQQVRRNKKRIRILLTKYSDMISSFLYYTGGKGYTHASISLEDDEQSCYYSFNYRGFCVETIEKHKRRGVLKSVCYELAVSEKAYEKIRKRLEFFKENRKEFQYTRLGLFCCLIKIPLLWKKHYFCSQFVAELLESSDEIFLQKQPALYLPNHFRYELEKSPCLSRICYNVV